MTLINQWQKLDSTAIKIALLALALFTLITEQSVAKTSDQLVEKPEKAETWQTRFTQLLRRRPPMKETPGTSRGGFCLLSPGESFEQGQEALWEQRPTLFWTGYIAKIAVHEMGSDEPLWHQLVPFNPNAEAAELKVLRYGGPALEAGKRYEWKAFAQKSDAAPQLVRPFLILKPEQRGPITRAWMQEQVKLVRAKATTEEQAMRRGEFVLEQKLSGDFYQALFLAEVRGQLDEEGRSIVGDVVAERCGKRN